MARRLSACAVAWLLLAAPPRLPAQHAGYEVLVGLYARGARAEALAGLERLSYNHAIQGYGELRAAALAAERCAQAAGEAEGRCQATQEHMRALLRAGVMLHWDRDDAERPPHAGTEQPRACPGKHAELAGRYAALLARWPETREFARRFFLTASHGCQWDFCLEPALRWARDGLKLFARDAELLLAAGSVLEESATLAQVRTREGIAGLRQRERDERQSVLAAREQRFREARRDFEEALEADAGLTLARVRLGRVLWRLGQPEAAAKALERAIEDQPAPAVLYLARLFLGQVHEDAGRLEQAVDQYRRGLALDPTSQAAAVALSHALRLAGDAEASRRILTQALAHARRGNADLYWNYLTSNALHSERDFDSLRRETLR